MATTPTAPRDFKVSKKNRAAIKFRLEGDTHVYSFKPHKRSGMVFAVLDATDENELASTRASLDWLEEGLSAADNARILARLKNSKDDLDFDDVGDVIEGLIEDSSGGRPTS